MVAISLSSVTVLGEESTLASESLFKNENTAFTPSASRNAVAGLNPLAVSNNILGQRVERGLLSLSSDVTGLLWRLLPKARCWAWSVPDQSRPLPVEGFIEVSNRRASMRT